ncbi:MAG: hypothetical protein OXB98_19840 [Bryobacterales bacterium]|nr:hypothetical protein [Bryobacterales bacterium]
MTDNPNVTTPDPHSLPDTMSGLLATAIADARKLDPKTYHPDCYRWHTAEKDTCAICFAGSLIAGTLQTSPDKTVFPESFTGDVPAKLDSLDCMRLGAWKLAYHKFYGQEPSFAIGNQLTYLPQPFCSYFRGWEEFRSHLISLEKAVEPLREIELDAEAV